MEAAIIQNYQETTFVKFALRQFGLLPIEGIISHIESKLLFNENNLHGSFLILKLKVNSLKTGNRWRDQVAKSSGMLNITAFPDIIFKSSFFVTHRDQYYVTGDLTIKGISKRIRFPFRLEDGKVKGTFTINRHDFELNGVFQTALMDQNIKVELNYQLP
ncbi:YceI family protein [Jiulongibacter sp. NS-SX5]|uniref:YceI family protein n=1 Tax=Jiulongibacter sp. NS-SX5 TaxID=3463854 RepID=UPI004059C4B3